MLGWGTEEPFDMIEMSCALILVVVTRVYKISKITKMCLFNGHIVLYLNYSTMELTFLMDLSSSGSSTISCGIFCVFVFHLLSLGILSSDY